MNLQDETIQIWNRCNNRCIMCTNPLWLAKETTSAYSFQRFAFRLATLPQTKVTGGLHISGGEPTLHPDFFNILDFIRARFPSLKLYLLTNGRMFVYEDFTERVLAFDHIFLQIPVLGHTSRLHDCITGVRGSFEQTVAGLKNITKRKNKKQHLEIRVVLVKQNLCAVQKIVEFAHTEFEAIDTFVIIFPEPEGRGAENFKRVGITYSQAKKKIFNAVEAYKDTFCDLRLYHFPLCAIDDRLWPFVWITQYPWETAFASTCSRCGFKKHCPGIHKNYLSLCGEGEFVRPANRVKLTLNKGISKKYHPIKGVQ